MQVSEDSAPSILFAHTLTGRPTEEWEPLEEHLAKVSETTAQFAEAFGARAWGELLGACHDLGKCSRAFQDYLKSAGGADAGVETEGDAARRVDHSTYGARFLMEALPDVRGQLLAHCIAGHHAGLPNDIMGEDGSSRGTLQYRLDAAQYKIPEVQLPTLLIPTLALSLKRAANKDEMPFQMAMFTRMLFSCLVDADRTRTEEFCSPDAAAERRGLAGEGATRPKVADLQKALRASLNRKMAEAKDTEVNRQRARVLSHCSEAASQPPGFFSLNVPTGGGKTLSSLAFALDHCVAHGLRRVVVAIPFTSIIEQTAEVYRQALGSLGDAALVEHHTNLQPTRETRANQLGTENWDAPLIVTTNVQLLESLFSSRTTPCRKLHRLAGSVIVLDEAQSIPVEYLRPILAALRELVLNYRCTIVLCTATQPALEWREDFQPGLQQVRPIIPESTTLFQALRRVQVHAVGRLSDDELSARLAEHRSVLCIVNTKKHAARLYAQLAALSDEGTCFHLSTWMCGAHRRAVLATIRERLRTGQPCRVVSTQLIEAGVDVDFPAVYRAETGFDSIAQAAGRCNREGSLPVGYTYVFEAEDRPPRGMLRSCADTARELQTLYPDPLTPDAVEAYFRLHYWKQKDRWDQHRVMEATGHDHKRKRAQLQFREVDQRFVLIREEQVSILIPFGAQGSAFLDSLLTNSKPFIPQRELQPYLVNVTRQAVQEMCGSVSEHASGVWLLDNRALYSGNTGLDPGSTALDESYWSA